MARALTRTAEAIAIVPPRRRGRYDDWLDGSIWELSLRDFRGRFKVRKARNVWRHASKAVRGRARVRGLSLKIHRLSDGTMVVQAWRRT